MSDPSRRIEVVIEDGAPPRLDKALALSLPEALGLSRSRLQALIAAGAVSRAGAEVRDPKTKTRAGEAWAVDLPEPGPAAAAPEAIPLTVVFEDADLIVIDKPAGMVVHPAPGAQTGTLVNALLHHCRGTLSGIGGTERPGIVHRIDKDTSGLIVAAKSDLAHQGLAAQFAAHTVERSYAALLWGAPDAGDPRLAGLDGVSFESGGVIRVSVPIGRHKSDRKKMAVRRDGGRPAVTRLCVNETYRGPDGPVAARTTCRLETGRTHQIRVHAAYLGHGLMGDPVYGHARRGAEKTLLPEVLAALAALPGQALHAGTLGFDHPRTGEKLRFSADPPAAFTRLSDALRGG